MEHPESGTAGKGVAAAPVRDPMDLSRLTIGPSAALRVDTDRRCTACGYSLQGLYRSGACPECATPIQQSLCPWVLGIVSDADIEGLLRGLRTLRASAWPLALSVLAALAIVVFVERKEIGPPLVLACIGIVAGSVMWSAGWSRVSGFPFPPWRSGACRLRGAVRAAAAVLLVVSGLMTVEFFIVGTAGGRGRAGILWVTAAVVFWSAAALVSAVLGQLLLRKLAAILPDGAVARQQRDVARLAAGAMIGGGATFAASVVSATGTMISAVVTGGILLALGAAWTSFLGTLIRAVEAQRWQGV